MAVLEAVGVPCAPVNDIPEVSASDQLAAVDLMRELPRSGLSVVGLPISFDRQRPYPYRDAPRLGEHNAEIFGSRRDTAAGH
jgi:formyl-CoA transferase